MSEILIVDDEAPLRKALSAQLAAEGYSVRQARNGDEALAKFAEKVPDLVLLDIDMPKKNGFRVCEEIRAIDPRVPVVFFTGKDSEVNDLKAMGVGGDYFVSKGDAPAILFARIRRALERSAALEIAAVPENGLKIGGRVFCTSGLTQTELEILTTLASNPGRFFTVDELIERLRGRGFACEDSMLYSPMSRLRVKLGELAVHLESVRGRGYRFV